ncbi:DUF488 domain-containing protein [Salipaludibacillus agaradhaerens]|jgi:uncharacterized protein YeaO (DUF488 family)|uniref:DUF488 domain-containing protein n=1 Tax=Salipaludibacillus agaradhaerens TaxID=76935 RepID=UPI0009989E0E|nr:DUF488 family protein [Salipaludibacillus agaradhaerens]
MAIKIKRAYERPEEDDGKRILVDRLWPRGLSKKELQFDEWCRDVAPSPELRQWFNHEPERFHVFANKYEEELNEDPSKLDCIIDFLTHIKPYKENITLLFGAKDKTYNHAVVLQKYLRDQYEQE